MKILDYIELPDYINKNNIISYKNLDNVQINDSQIIYLNLSEDFLENGDIEQWLSNQTNKCIIINNVDIDFPPPKKPWRYDKYYHLYPEIGLNVQYKDKIQMQLLEILEKNNLFIISCSVSVNHPRVLNFPIGIYHNFEPRYFHYKTKNKRYLCYANFGIPCDRWYGNPRKNILPMIKNKTFIYTENNKSQDEFYQTISQSKFTICPRGCGIDTYRLWDTICLGSIPIIEKTDGHFNLLDLPIYFIDSIYEIEKITEEQLEKKYEEMMNIDFNYYKLTIQYWENIMKNIFI